MIERSQALDILGSSVLEFMKRNGNLTKENLKIEIQNNICLYFLINQRIQANAQTNLSDMMQNILNNAQNTNPIIKVFTDAAKEMFHENYNEKDALITLLDVNEILEEKDSWLFLKQYFMKYHNHEIGDWD